MASGRGRGTPTGSAGLPRPIHHRGSGDGPTVGPTVTHGNHFGPEWSRGGDIVDPNTLRPDKGEWNTRRVEASEDSASKPRGKIVSDKANKQRVKVWMWLMWPLARPVRDSVAR